MAGGGVIHDLHQSLKSGTLMPTRLAEEALARSNANAGRNTYLWQRPAFTLAEAGNAESLRRKIRSDREAACSQLWGLPISVKDCFNLAGAPTSCGTIFYRDLNGPAKRDSWLVEQLRSAGAVITGKTHLHPLAYGITGENPDFGDCLQPGHPTALTGGSSSGAAASVLEGSAVAAIGTDTGGSIRVPAALCGLAGYRASIGRGNWRGGFHLAPSFDTMGWLFRDLRDAPLLASPFAPSNPPRPQPFTRFAWISEGMLSDCDPEVIAGYQAAIRELESLGLASAAIEPVWWSESLEIYAPIQAYEAAQIHAGNFEHIQPGIRERLQWGAAITKTELISHRQRHQIFRSQLNRLFAAHELILMPCSPVAQLTAGADHSQTRMRLLRYTTPFSLGGVPAVTIPCAHGGVQLAAPAGADESLLAFAAQVGNLRANQ